jgi:hypothetical protein
VVIDASQSVGGLPLDVAARAVHDIMVNRERGCARGAGAIPAARPAPDINACAQWASLPSSGAKFCTSCREPVTLEDQDEAPPAAPDAPPVHWLSPGPSAAPVSSSPPGPSAPSPPPRKPAGPNSDPTGNTIFVLAEVHESPAGVDAGGSRSRKAGPTRLHGVERQGQREHAAQWNGLR